MCGPAAKVRELKLRETFQGFGGFIVDIEGVLIKGERLIAGAPEALAALGEAKVEPVFLSNISDLTRQEVAARLKRLGLDIPAHQILTSAYATALFLAEKYPAVKRLLLIGSDSFGQELTARGFNLTADHEQADAVVVGLDYALNYEKICAAARAIKRGSLFIAANLAKIKLTADNYTVGPGFTAMGLTFVTGKSPEVVGKPSAFMFRLALDRLGLKPAEVLTIGDKLEQDIYGGRSMGTAACLVLSGAAARSDIAGIDRDHRPDFILDSIVDLLEPA
jgi:HAD superfamily hydrolase (TIGR01450 family)